MKVCVIRLDALGDTLLSTPAIRLLVDAGADVTVLTHPVGTPILRGLARTLEFTPQTRAREMAAAMARLKPDGVMIFSEKRRAVAAAQASGAARRVGFDPGLSQPLKSLWLKVALTDRVPFANRLDSDPGYHEVERYCRQVQAIYPGVPRAPKLWLEILPEERETARQWLNQQSLERPLGLQLTPKWALHGCQAEELRHLVTLLPQPLLGFYGPGEKQWVEESFRDSPLKLCYQPNLHLYGALLAQCQALVTVDTGAAHVAAAVGTPTLDIFPRVNNAHCVRRWRPWQVEHRVVLSDPLTPAQLFTDIQESLTSLLSVQPC